MNTLTTFPMLLDFGLFAPLALRLMVAVFILMIGLERYKKPYNWTIVFYALSGIMLALGLYTQIVSIIGIAIIKFDFYTNYWIERENRKVGKEIYMLYWMAGIILLSLLVTGPGLFAFDLPF